MEEDIKKEKCFMEEDIKIIMDKMGLIKMQDGTQRYSFGGSENTKKTLEKILKFAYEKGKKDLRNRMKYNTLDDEQIKKIKALKELEFTNKKIANLLGVKFSLVKKAGV